MANAGESQNRPHRLGEHVDAMGSIAQQLLGEAREAAGELQQTLDLKGRIERNPYATLAAAAGIGYVLGGGLFTSLTMGMVRLGLKIAAIPLVRNELGMLLGSDEKPPATPSA